jgi:hypothetical protein
MRNVRINHRRVSFRSRSDLSSSGTGAPAAGRGAETQTAAAHLKPARQDLLDQPVSVLGPLGRGPRHRQAETVIGRHRVGFDSTGVRLPAARRATADDRRAS